MSDSSSSESDCLSRKSTINANVVTNKSQSFACVKISDHIIISGTHSTAELEEDERKIEPPPSFEKLGVCEPLCQACERLDWKIPTKIQVAALAHALRGRDVIGLAETGSGKTAAFAIPILQSLLETPQKLFALVLTPTRELAFQIAQQFEALGAGIGLLVAVIVGGVDMTTQAFALAKRPHVIVATPGRLVDHLENTKGFNLRALKYLVMDEADRILNMDFEVVEKKALRNLLVSSYLKFSIKCGAQYPRANFLISVDVSGKYVQRCPETIPVELDKILRVIPKERHTYLFSATMTKKVAKLERASLKDPARVEVSTKYKTVDKLKQNYLFIPFKYKEAYLVYLLNELAGNTAIVFCATCNTAMHVGLLLFFSSALL
ncbi:unnamed protein product [Strongylus vulgaris]|uniref:RNA helicase n=1 Tax=Strongylus vulgaris TaxID=40348 RepID=A0A3P7IBJ8_STRVU|nr:unnamed protein product [Strongylus vulgaris]